MIAKIGTGALVAVVVLLLIGCWLALFDACSAVQNAY
jgi:uncharacterized membrane protein YccF (DUF307 family)